MLFEIFGKMEKRGIILMHLRIEIIFLERKLLFQPSTCV